jgi:hypothetical protein
MTMKLSHAKKRALRDAGLVKGGLKRAGDSFLFVNPERADVFYQANTVSSLLAEGLLAFRTDSHGRTRAILTPAGYLALPPSWRADVPAPAHGG